MAAMITGCCHTNTKPATSVPIVTTEDGGALEGASRTKEIAAR